jgi:hypothetical protein
MATIMGATVDQSTYPGSTSKFNSAQIFDGYLGAPWAESVCKVYWTEGKWGQMQVTDLKGLSLVQNGVHLLISFQPARSTTGTYTVGTQATVTGTTIAQELASFTTVIAAYQALGASFDGILWQEMDNGGSGGAFPTPGHYQRYVAYYHTALQAAGVPRVYDPSMLIEANAVGYYPGDIYVDKVACDYYCESFILNGSTLTGMISLAQNHSAGPVPFSVYEFGWSASSRLPTLAQFTSWIINQLQAPLLAYINAGGTVEYCVWFGSFDNWNWINASTSATQIQAMLNLGGTLGAGGVTNPSVVLPDFIDFQDVQGAANAIAATGVPLLSNSTIQVAQSTFIVAGGALVQLPVLPVSQLGYELQVSASIGGAATIPFVQLEMQWTDILSNLIVSDEKWGIPCGNGAAVNTIMLTGPTKGSQLGVQLKNLDPAVLATVTIVMLYNSRTYARDRAMQTVTNNPPGYTYVGNHSAYGVVASLSAFPVNAGNAAQRLFPLYAGDVSFYCDQAGNGAANSQLELQIAPITTFDTAPLWSASPTGGVGNGITQILRFPRAPVLLTYTNTGAAQAIVNAKVIALDESH